MRKFLLLGTVFVATTAFAFGGIFGGDSSSSRKSAGVDAIGVHMNGKGKANIVPAEPEEVCAEGILKDRFGHCNICKNGNVYLSYMDDPCSTAMTPKSCETGSDCWQGVADNTCCSSNTHTCKHGNAYWDSVHGRVSYACSEDNNKNCKSNKDCESNEFCNLMNDEDNSEKPNIGVCMAIGDVISGTTESLGEIIMSSFGMQWWGAENWCAAQGKSLIKVSELHCYQKGTEIELTEQDGYEGPCCVKGENCDYRGTWQTSDFSPVLREVYSAMSIFFDNTPSFWTITNTQNPYWCQLSYGYCGQTQRVPLNHNVYNALCR